MRSKPLRQFHRLWACVLMSAVGLSVLLTGTSAPAAEERMVVHEWGTFTTLQDAAGVELSGINVDDEPVPEFVHNLSRFLLSATVLSSPHWRERQKGAPRRHPFVTVRLETPVIYFYPPAGGSLPAKLDVSVRFRGGWLTEFYPQAEANAPGLKDWTFEFGELTSETVSSLAWNDLRVGTEAPGPEASEHVWTAPRKVRAVGVTSAEGESEKYLFYRGVGRFRAPLRVVTHGGNKGDDTLTLHANFDSVLAPGEAAMISRPWLVDVRPDGAVAYRELPQLRVSADVKATLASTPRKFARQEYGQDHLVKLQASMHRELVAAGLFADEATAMLSTWRRAYFTSPGLRLFFVVPRKWTDHYLPLSLSQPAHVERVMMARIELISPQQQSLLDRMANTAPSDGKWIDDLPPSPARAKFLAGRADFGDLGVPIPTDYQIYLALGRFRNALVVAEERRRPIANLTRFIDTYELHPFRLQPDPLPTSAESRAAP